MEDKETIEEIKAELEETRDILKDRIITKINKREELLDDLDGINTSNFVLSDVA